MPSRFWNRPVIDGRKMLLEPLEERIVLDASIDNAFSGTEAIVNSQQSCTTCSTQFGASSPGSLHAPFNQGPIGPGGDDFVGRLQTDNVPEVRGTLHASDPPAENRQVQIVSALPDPHTVYVKFFDYGQGCKKWGAGGQYTPADFPGWTASDDCFLLSCQVGASQPAPPLNFDKPASGEVTVTVSLDTTTGCAISQAEMTLGNCFLGECHDGYDISLVNGFNFPVKINAPYPEVKDPYTPGNPIRCTPTIQATSQLGNSTNVGVFGLGNDQCCASCKPPCDCCDVWGDQIIAEAHPTYLGVQATCLAGDPYCTCDNATPHAPHTGAAPCDARPRCQMDGWQSQATGNTFTVTFGP